MYFQVENLNIPSGFKFKIHIVAVDRNNNQALEPLVIKKGLYCAVMDPDFRFLGYG